VDIVLEIEDAFSIEVSDEAADQVKTVGDAVKLIVENKAA
jgi:acyl carrier protein